MEVGTEEDRQRDSEMDVLEHVAKKVKTYLVAKKKTIMAADKFDLRRQQSGESLDALVINLKLIERELDMA